MPQLRVGDWVYIKSHVQSKATDDFNARLTHRWEGAYRVVHDHSAQVFTVDRPGLGPIMVHIYQMKAAPTVNGKNETNNESINGNLIELKKTGEIEPPPCSSMIPSVAVIAERPNQGENGETAAAAGHRAAPTPVHESSQPSRASPSSRLRVRESTHAAPPSTTSTSAGDEPTRPTYPPRDPGNTRAHTYSDAAEEFNDIQEAQRTALDRQQRAAGAVGRPAIPSRRRGRPTKQEAARRAREQRANNPAPPVRDELRTRPRAKEKGE